MSRQTETQKSQSRQWKYYNQKASVRTFQLIERVTGSLVASTFQQVAVTVAGTTQKVIE